ncbi:MFS sugar transporter [Streptomyces sulfonofaciens]|uniref:MFS sugar transporter n=1 Tax=Streptomyces sulfonofaciens TaxID=68272 RepID=A0A919GBB2_9ACTN|nr:MFS transporter [Streptomyces sulfonofaciens]GHH81289.1 MFS sugar transporter [Streptomyces sulfonofaciens]
MLSGRPGAVKGAAFGLGSLLVVVGVLLHFPSYLGVRDDGFMMADMGMDPAMTTGMVLILVGLAAAGWGLLPTRAQVRARAAKAPTARFTALDTAKFTGAHRALVTVLTVALVVDTMKPASLGFVVPGMRMEYDLSADQASLLPLVAIVGTVVGSLVWGWAADLYGRRSTVLMSSLMYVATSICGFMPSFQWNLVMCFLMGMAAGGMLPTVYSLMSESVPSRHRGWLVVAQSGFSAAVGYLVASGCSTLLVPHFSWRVLWLLNLPTGLLLLMLRRWIPESPRFLIASGREDEAAQIMARYGIRAVATTDRDADAPTGAPAAAPAVPPVPAASVLAPALAVPPASAVPDAPDVAAGPNRLTTLVSPAFRRQTGVIVLFGVSWGLVNWGFITFLPTFLSAAGAGTHASSLLFVSSVFAVPATGVAAVLYARWSSKKAMIGYAVATALVLAGFAVLRPERPGHGTALVVLTALLLSAAGGMIALLAPYATEVYPTALRATGSGVAAAGSKAGGLFGPLLLTSAPGIEGLAVVCVVPLVAAGLVLARYGAETLGKPLVETATGPAPGLLKEPADT